jgi:hypothetical protein
LAGSRNNSLNSAMKAWETMITVSLAKDKESSVTGLRYHVGLRV